MNTHLARYGLVAALGVFGAVGCHSDEVMVTKHPTTVSLGVSTPEQKAKRHFVLVNQMFVDTTVSEKCGLPTPHFEFDSAQVTIASDDNLDQVARCFTTGPLAGRRIKLTGRADPRGTASYNYKLGMQRADQVAIYLDSKGIDSSRITTVSRGELDAQGGDQQTWADDRRVDISIAD